MLLKNNTADPKAYAVFFQLLVGVMIATVGFLFTEMTFPSNWQSLLPNLVLMMFLYGFGNLFVFQALKKTEASTFIIIFSSRVLITILVSSFFLNESLNFLQIIGTLLILASILLVNIKSAKLTFSKKELTSLLSALCFGLAVSNDSFLVKHFDLYPFVTIAFILPPLLIIATDLTVIKKMKVFWQKTTFAKMFLLSTIYALAAVFFFIALQTSKNSSQVASLDLVGVIVTVLLAVIFLKERDDLLKKILGAILSFIGLMLMR